jgi:hypothetical protein
VLGTQLAGYANIGFSKKNSALSLQHINHEVKGSQQLGLPADHIRHSFTYGAIEFYILSSIEHILAIATYNALCREDTDEWEVIKLLRLREPLYWFCRLEVLQHSNYSYP